MKTIGFESHENFDFELDEKKIDSNQIKKNYIRII